MTQLVKMRGLHERRPARRKAMWFVKSIMYEIKRKAASGIFILQMIFHPRLKHFKAIARTILVTGKSDVVKFEYIRHSLLFDFSIISHASGIIPLIIPSKNAPGYSLAILIIRRVDPATDFPFGNIERPPVGFRFIRIVGKLMIAIILWRKCKFIGHIHSPYLHRSLRQCHFHDYANRHCMLRAFEKPITSPPDQLPVPGARMDCRARSGQAQLYETSS